MRIGILIPHIYTSSVFKDRIFAPLTIGLKLIDGLVDKGHEVYVYTSVDVKTKAKIVPGPKRASDENLDYYQFRNRSEQDKKVIALEARKRFFQDVLTLQAYKDFKDGKLDIIHSYHDFDAHYFDELTKYPTVYTLHDPLPHKANTIEFLRYSKFQNHNYISISNSQRKSIVPLNFVATIYHGIDIKEFEYGNKPENYYIYFGRVLRDKGVDIAIKLALQMGFKLKIATSPDATNRDQEYFTENIEPFIDGNQIELVGFLSGKEKSDFIKHAKAFIFPLQWDEPFGLVMVEAMACGTPVIAFNHGSVPEVVENGKTGFVVPPEEGIQGLTEAVQKIEKIDRAACRKRVEEKFTVQKMIENYEKVYQQILEKQMLPNPADGLLLHGLGK